MRGNKLADIVISPRDSDASASWIGAGLQKKPSVSSYKSLQPATHSVLKPDKGGSQWSSYLFFLISIFNPFSIHVYLNHFVSFPPMSIFKYFMSNLFSSALLSRIHV